MPSILGELPSRVKDTRCRVSLPLILVSTLLDRPMFTIVSRLKQCLTLPRNIENRTRRSWSTLPPAPRRSVNRNSVVLKANISSIISSR